MAKTQANNQGVVQGAMWALFSESVVVFLLSSIAWLFVSLNVSNKNFEQEMRHQDELLRVEREAKQNRIEYAFATQHMEEPRPRPVELKVHTERAQQHRPKPQRTIALNLQQEASYADAKADTQEQKQEVLDKPSTTIEERLEEKQWVQDYQNTQKQAYVEQFVDNAKQAGYRARVNKNLDVVEFKNIR